MPHPVIKPIYTNYQLVDLFLLQMVGVLRCPRLTAALKMFSLYYFHLYKIMVLYITSSKGISFIVLFRQHYREISLAMSIPLITACLHIMAESVGV